MAKVLKEFQFINHPSMYPWDKWLDGQTWQITQGKDFKCNMPAFRSVAANTAHKRGGKLRTHVRGKKVVIQFFREPNR